MARYRVHFIDGNFVDTDIKSLKTIAKGEDTIANYLVSKNKIFINFDKVSYIEKISESEEAIVTPPTPEQINAEREKEKAKRNADLNAILSKKKDEMSEG